MLEGASKDEQSKDRVCDLFASLEENPPTDRIKTACNENMHRAGGKLLDRSRYTPNPTPTREMVATARSFCDTCIDRAWEVE